jgi:hypothetical protein
VLLISNSKGDSSQERNNCQSEESLHQIEEDMIMLGAIDKKNPKLKLQTQWKSVARQCPLLTVAERKTTPVVMAKVNDIKTDAISAAITI